MSKFRKISCQRGFTLLELAVVVVVVAVLFLTAVSRLMSLQVDAERVTMEMQAGVLRSALGLQSVKYFVEGREKELSAQQLINPMRFLVEAPGNYLGELQNPDPDSLDAGSWHFDSGANCLVYLVKNHLFFRTELAGPARIRFRVEPVCEEGAPCPSDGQVVGLRLVALDAYEWLTN